MYLILLFISLPLTLRLIYGATYIYIYTGKLFSDFSPVFYIILGDSVIYFIITLSLLLITLLKREQNTFFIKFIIFATLIVYLSDLIAIMNFSVRLTLEDVLKYGPYSFKYLNQMYTWHVSWKKFAINIAISSLFLYLTIYFFLFDFKNNYFIHILISTLFFLSMTIYSLLLRPEGSVYAWLYENVFLYNINLISRNRQYSDFFIKNNMYQEKEECGNICNNDLNGKNIIILMVESLSNYQSLFFSGINNWTPNIDKIALNNISYKNFYANGYTTEDAEVSILTGIIPIKISSNRSPIGNESFAGFYSIAESLPNIFATKQFTTEFITSSDLEFSNTRNWAKSIGFDYIEGHEHSYYNNFKRLHFKAAPDRALYNRVIDRVQEQKGKYFIFVKTVSSHVPFIHPETNERSEEKVIRYVDQQINFFYDELKKINFFSSGILIIVGDHHAMTILRKAEIDMYGLNRAPAKVPMIIIDGKNKYIDKNLYQQTDIFKSITGCISTSFCLSGWNGNFFDKKTSRYIIHKRGDDRGIINIISDNEEYIFTMNGDDSNVIGGNSLDTETREMILKNINSIRIRNTEKVKEEREKDGP